MNVFAANFVPVLAVLLAASSPASATRLHYVAYAAGFRVVDIAADVAIDPDDYRMSVTVHTVGLFSALVSGLTTTEVSGRWAGIAAAPIRYDSEGHWKGHELETIMDYQPSGPVIRALSPDPDPDLRDTVPPSLRVGTVDTLSAMAALVHQIAALGTCEAAMRLFDGKRLSQIQARTVGTETLEPTGRSVFAGPALRCDFTGHLLAGFPTDEDLAHAARPKEGSAWFARLSPDGPRLPVRIVFETRFFGHATMYLADDQP